MEEFKIENFKRINHKQSFPWFHSLTNDECRVICLNFEAILGVKDVWGTKKLVEFLIYSGQIIEDTSGESDDFSLREVLSSNGVNADDSVYINWYRFDDIDEMHLNDLDKYFDDIWYPGPDDIDIFDSSFLWVLTVSHNGTLILN